MAPLGQDDAGTDLLFERLRAKRLPGIAAMNTGQQEALQLQKVTGDWSAAKEHTASRLWYQVPVTVTNRCYSGHGHV